MSDIDIAAVDSLKVLDLNRPIREADKLRRSWFVRFVPKADVLILYGCFNWIVRLRAHLRAAKIGRPRLSGYRR